MVKPAALASVEAACVELASTGQAVTFSRVAQLAGISRPTLYRDLALRAVVEEHRTKANDPRTLSGITTEIAHLRTAVEILSERVKSHEERIRKIEQPLARKAN